MRPHHISLRVPIKMLRARRSETASVSRLLSTGSFRVVEMATNQNNNHVRSYIMHVHAEKYFANVGRSRLRPNSKFKIEFMFNSPYFVNMCEWPPKFVAHFRMPCEVKQAWQWPVHCPHTWREFSSVDAEIMMLHYSSLMAKWRSKTEHWRRACIYPIPFTHIRIESIQFVTQLIHRFSCYANLCPSGQCAFSRLMRNSSTNNNK